MKTVGKHNPKHQYDCPNCKFYWSCGHHCSCGLKEFPEISETEKLKFERKHKFLTLK